MCFPTSLFARRELSFSLYLGFLGFLPSISWGVEKSGILTADETWSGSIEITNSVTINEGVTVTIQPATIIKSNTSGSIIVDGTLSAVGTAGSPIIFTSINDDSVGGDTNADGNATSPAAGDWPRIELASGDTANVALEHVTMQYCGRSSSAAITVRSGQLSIQDVEIEDSSVSALYFLSSTSGEFTISNLTLARIGTSTSHFGIKSDSVNATITCTNLNSTDVFGPHVELNNSVGKWSSTGSTFSGTGIKAIKVRLGTIEGDVVWADSVPYYLENPFTIADTGSLTINPGTVVVGTLNGKINNRGVLSAMGTSESPIIFTSFKDDTVAGDINGDADATTPAVSDWSGIETTTATGNTTLDFCTFRYGGRSQNTTLSCRLGISTISNCTIQDANGNGIYVLGGNAVLRNNTINNVSDFGMYFGSSNGFAIVENNTIDGALSGAYFMRIEVQLDISGTTAVNSGLNNGIQVEGSFIQEDQVWQEPLVYYSRLGHTVAENATWTLAPGTRIKLAANRKLSIWGELVAIGTEDEPIQMTSFLDDTIGGDTNEDADATVASAGDWDGLFGDRNGCILDLNYVEIHYAGRGTANPSAALRLNSGSSYNVLNSLIANSQYHGISISTQNFGTISSTTIRDVGGHGIWSGSFGSSTPSDLTFNTIENSGLAPVQLPLSVPFDLTGTTLSADPNSRYIQLVGDQVAPGKTITFLADTTYVFTDVGGISGHLSINQGGSVIVEEGAVLKFDKHYGILLDGHIELRGTEANPVIVTSVKDDTAGGDTNGDGNATLPEPGDWFSIWLRDAFVSQQFSVATGIFENVEIRYAGEESAAGGGADTPSVLMDGGTYDMKNLTILDSLDSGIRARFSALDATIDGLKIIGSPSAAISLWGGTISMNDVFIDDIVGEAISMDMSDLNFTLTDFEVGDNVGMNATRVTEGTARFPVVLGHTPLVILESTLLVVSTLLGHL
jgi:hypothetical protein